MSGLDDDYYQVKAQRRGLRAVVTRYVQEVRWLLEVECLQYSALRRLNTLSRLLKEKGDVLWSFDLLITEECPAKEIEREAREAVGIHAKIEKSLKDIDSVNTEARPARRKGKPSVSRDH